MVEYLIGGLHLLIKGKEFQDTQKLRKSAALSAIKLALRATKKHITEKSKDKFNEAASQDLAEKWSKAAELIRPFSIDVANRFESKSDYWTNPRGFQREIQDGTRRLDFRIRIENVEKTVKELEHKWKL